MVDSRLNVAGDLSAPLEARFDAIDAHFVDLRRYVEFAHDDLEKRVTLLGERITRLEERVIGLEQQFTARFNRLERKLDQFIDAQLRFNEQVDRRLRTLGRRRASRS